MRKALAEHRERFAKVAREGELVVGAARETIDARRERSRRELDERLKQATEESAGSARAEFERAAARVGELAAAERGPRVGSLTLRTPGGERQKLEVPVLLPLLDEGHIVVRAPEDRRQEALGAVAGVLLSALASKPLGEVRYRIFDPIGTGSSLSAFGEFDQERIAHGLPISDADGLRTAVGELSRHATMVSSTFLRGKHSSLGEFLAEAGPGFAPYELLVLLDLPRAIDPELAERLSQLASHAASRGISFVAHMVEGADPALSLGPTATELSCDDRGNWSCSAIPDATIALQPPPGSAEIQQVAERPVPPPTAIEFSSLRDSRERFTKSSAEGLAAVVGSSGLDPVEVLLDDDTVHGLIAGDTGSGKSNLLRVLIYGLAHDYSPQELQLYLLDFKESVEFREFAATQPDPTYLPHARVVSVNSSRAFGVAVLEHLAEVTSRRYAELEGARKLSALREQRPDVSFPRLLAVVDEFQVLFNQGDLLADRAAAALAQVASQGRAAGVHLLLSTQSISDVAAGTNAGARIEPVYKNSRLRIGLRLGEAESRTLLRMSNPAAAEIQDRGTGIVNHEDGAEEDNVLTKFALISDEQARHERREAVSRAGGMLPRPPRVFDGSRGADAADNLDLRRGGGAAGTWIGAPLAVDDDDPRRQPSLFVPLPPDPNRHLATIGAGARSAAAALQWAAIGFARRCGEGSSLLLVDLLREDDGLPGGLVEATAAVVGKAGASVEVLADREAATLLPCLERFLLGEDEAPRAAVVFGFDRIRNFAGAGESEFDPSSPRQALDRILTGAGTNHGHLFAWWSTYDAFSQQVGLRDASFGLRVYLGMSHQQLQLIAPGEMDTAPAYPTAYWHDYGAGTPPQLFQLYEPFGRGQEPEYLNK